MPTFSGMKFNAPKARLLEAAGLGLFYGFNCIDDTHFDARFNDLNGFHTERAKLFNGDVVNLSENRAAWHTALRNPEPIKEVAETLARMKALKLDGITDIVNIGIGGSDLGPAFIYDALNTGTAPRCHFVSNIDELNIQRVLKNLNQSTTAFVIVSKTFTTLETLSNAHYAKNWANENTLFFAVSTNLEKVKKFGIPADNTFPIWDWVGGRYSTWSAAALSLVLSLGFEVFERLLAGAHAMDQHFLTADDKANMPLIMALLCHWYDQPTQAIIPYTEKLRRLPDYLQQLWMESLGKSVDPNGSPITHNTGPIIWGGTGTNTQHSFHQLLMQGTHCIPVNFILALKQNSAENQAAITTNCLAQMKALWYGRDAEESSKIIQPGHPCNLITMDQVTPENLGALIALNEHIVFTLGVLYGVNPFDQWGVEWGKVLFKQAKLAPKTTLSDCVDTL